MMRSLLTAAVLVVAPVVVLAAPPHAERLAVKAAAAPTAPLSFRKFRRLASLTSGRLWIVLLIGCLTIRVSWVIGCRTSDARMETVRAVTTERQVRIGAWVSAARLAVCRLRPVLVGNLREFPYIAMTEVGHPILYVACHSFLGGH
ncbi:hypothetical protein D3C73_1278670 [compost metagenome]